MLYIHHTSCISPQQTFTDTDLSVLHPPQAGNKLKVIEPAYTGIPPGVLRRMSKVVRIGVGAALPLLQQQPAPDGIIIGTANAGMEDCFHFLKQMADYNEGLLTPGSFVQSTPNTIAAQLGIINRNKGYNVTHVHLGLAFENAVIDAAMMLLENPQNHYLLGAVDDIAAYHYTLNSLAGWYKKEQLTGNGLYDLNTPGSIAGEGAAMFLVKGNAAGAIASIKATGTIHTSDVLIVAQQLQQFIDKNLPEGEQITMLVSGEDGDNRLEKYYAACEQQLPTGAAILRYKHLTGEYPTATAFALWLSCHYLQGKPIPAHCIKRTPTAAGHSNILIYNCYKGMQHGFMLVTATT